VSPPRAPKDAPPPPEKPDSNRTILVGVYGREVPRALAEDHLDELERLGLRCADAEGASSTLHKGNVLLWAHADVVRTPR